MEKRKIAYAVMLIGATLHGMQQKNKSEHNIALYQQSHPRNGTSTASTERESLTYIMDKLYTNQVSVRDPQVRERIKQAFIVEQEKLRPYFRQQHMNPCFFNEQRMREITLSEKNDFVERLLLVNCDDD